MKFFSPPTLAALTGLCLPLAAAAQDTEDATARITNGQKFGAWTVACEAIAVGETACVLTQRLVRSADKAFLAELLAFWSRDGEKTYIAVRVPNGVFFPSGFAIGAQGSDERQPFVWQSCSRELCEALLEIDPETLEALEAEENLVAGYRPNVSQKPAVFRLSLAGAVDGLTALKDVAE